jgi:Tfp pilus assembly protein PilO
MKLNKIDLKSIRLDWLKRPVTLIAAGSVIVLAMLWWFMWMSPQTAKLATVNDQISTLSTQDNALVATLATDKQYSAKVGLYAGYLKMFATAVPEEPEAGALTTDLATLADSISPSLHITSLTDDSSAPGVAPSLLSTVPITLELNGPRQDCFAFLDDLYNQNKIARLITVTDFTPTPLTGLGSNILKTSTRLYSFSITGDAYYDPAINPGAAGSSSVASG